MVHDHNPFEVLRELESRAARVGAQVPLDEERKPVMTGIAFRLGHQPLLAPLGEVQEVLECPSFTTVPRAKAWLRGLANVRGRLLPIVDLKTYLGDRATALTDNTRIMVVNYGTLSVGLMVDEVQGQRHFYEEEGLPISTTVPWKKGLLQENGFRRGQDTWWVFNVRQLVVDPQFVQAGM